MATQYTAGLTTGQVLTAATMNQIGAAWETYTPTWSGTGGTPTLGNGTLSGRWARIQKTAFLQIRLTWGSTTAATSISEWRFTFPTNLGPANLVNLGAIGSAAVLDSGTAVYRSVVLYQASPERFLIYASDGASTIGSTVPMTWTTNDQLTVNCTYEVA